MNADSYTLREFINKLEKLSDNGKNDNLKVGLMDYDDEVQSIGWMGIETVYPQEEIEESNPQSGEKMFVIQL